MIFNDNIVNNSDNILKLVSGVDFVSTCLRNIEDKIYVERIIERAISINIDEDWYWLKLNHYKKGILGKYESEIDDPHFFNSKYGKNDPKLELVETLKAFFLENTPTNHNLHAQCRFPAKFEYLD